MVSHVYNIHSSFIKSLYCTENLQPEDIHLEIKPFPETEGKHACLNGYYQMICHHPDIQSQLDNHKVFYASSPSWKVDGVPIIIDGQLKNITTLTKFKTLLKLRIHPDIYKEKYYNFTCFLTLRNGSILESKALKVHIVGKHCMHNYSIIYVSYRLHIYYV